MHDCCTVPCPHDYSRCVTLAFLTSHRLDWTLLVPPRSETPWQVLSASTYRRPWSSTTPPPQPLQTTCTACSVACPQVAPATQPRRLAAWQTVTPAAAQELWWLQGLPAHHGHCSGTRPLMAICHAGCRSQGMLSSHMQAFGVSCAASVYAETLSL